MTFQFAFQLYAVGWADLAFGDGVGTGVSARVSYTGDPLRDVIVAAVSNATRSQARSEIWLDSERYRELLVIERRDDRTFVTAGNIELQTSAQTFSEAVLSGAMRVDVESYAEMWPTAEYPQEELKLLISAVAL